MNLLVTGGAGFIGSTLVDALLAQKHTVVVVDNLSTGKKENVSAAAVFEQCDLTDAALGDVFAKYQPQIVFHLAAQINVRKSVDDPVWDATQNILGSINVLEQCRKYGVKKIIFSSTGGAIYGATEKIPTDEQQPTNPLSPYGIAKLAVEKYIHYYHHVFGLAFTILRYSNVYGPRQNSKGEAGVVAVFSDTLLTGGTPVIFGDGSQRRDYVFVDDVVAANLRALTVGTAGTYNIGTGIETDVNTLAALIRESLHSSVVFSHGPDRPGEVARNCLDATKAQKELEWKPRTDLQTGIAKTTAWFTQQHGR